MKVLLVVAAFAFVVACQALTENEKAAMRKLYTECVKATNADEDLIKKLRTGEDINDDGVKKYMGCMFTKLGFVKEGVIQEDKIKTSVPSDFDKDEALKILSECKNVKGESSDDIALLLYKCFLKRTTKFLEF